MPKGVYVRESLEERFWRQVDRSGGPDACWPWTGSRFHFGHGNVWVGGRNRPAHRIAVLLVTGKEPEGVGRHTCDNPPCCNPAHIVEGTQGDNVRDRSVRGRTSRHGGSARGERNGTYTHPESLARGTRQPGAKLTDEAVREMRRLFDDGEHTTYQLADAYGVSQALAYQVVCRRAWKHVA